METQGATLKCFLILDVQRDCYEMTGSRVKCAALAGHFFIYFSPQAVQQSTMIHAGFI